MKTFSFLQALIECYCGNHVDVVGVSFIDMRLSSIMDRDIKQFCQELMIIDNRIHTVCVDEK